MGEESYSYYETALYWKLTQNKSLDLKTHPKRAIKIVREIERREDMER
jgi:hypothetical protein